MDDLRQAEQRLKNQMLAEEIARRRGSDQSSPATTVVVNHNRASDIECPTGFSIINKDLLIATVDERANFEMDIYATRSRGFRTFQDNRDRVNAIGIIAIDSNFSPVISVAYSVDEIKTAKRGTSDKLTMELATNGSTSPADTIGLAARILASHLEPLIAINDRLQEIQVMKDKELEEKSSALAIPIEDLGLAQRSYNALKRANIQTIQELTSKTKDEVNVIRNLGRKSVKELTAKLTERGLRFREA
ncbi:unnamed protein product [Didymodactylos carnosus]|uniref:DNA-directed RNA polymerase n=1 Tax=Didymodactylos carnosus TaxID=1234261 RepID=A0A8S2GLY5_9BILA|nr:unnamed protein product [Didymodactylos carnosus]CAF3532597.1 unnamed protein product [Didymodactylos carnosus]